MADLANFNDIASAVSVNVEHALQSCLHATQVQAVAHFCVHFPQVEEACNRAANAESKKRTGTSIFSDFMSLLSPTITGRKEPFCGSSGSGQRQTRQTPQLSRRVNTKYTYSSVLLTQILIQQ